MPLFYRHLELSDPGAPQGYVKLTTGYGETLIDYNWKQNTIGAGILLVDWL